MIPGAETILSAPVTTVGVVVLFMLALMTGIVVPGKTAKDRIADANKRADDWATLYAGSQAEGQVLRAQVIALSQGTHEGQTDPGTNPPETVSQL